MPFGIRIMHRPLVLMENKKLMKKYRLWLISFAVLIIIGHLIFTDYRDLS